VEHEQLLREDDGDEEQASWLCSRSDGMDPSASKGRKVEWSMNISSANSTALPARTMMSSRWRTRGAGNHTGATYESGRKEKSLMWLNRCQRPTATKPAPGRMWPMLFRGVPPMARRPAGGCCCNCEYVQVVG
jgi:hypothetical protein